MHPIQVLALVRVGIRAVTRLPSVIADIPRSVVKTLNSPPRKESEMEIADATAHRINEQTQMKEKRSCRLPEDQISRETRAAYAKGMRYWNGGFLTKQNKEQAIKWIGIAARGGLADAVTMARMHGIEF